MFNERTVPSDVTIIILSLLGKGKGKNIPARIPVSNNFLYEEFFELSQDKDFRLLFQDFVFNTGAIYPYCEAVEIAINRITKFGLVEWKNPEIDYNILPALVSRGKQLMKLFSVVDRDQLSKAGEKFKAMVDKYYGKKSICAECKRC